MEITGDYQANFENDIWGVFEALGLGYKVYLYEPADRGDLWCIAPKESTLSDYYEEYKIIKVLIDNELVEETKDKLIVGTSTRYELTGKGKGLYSEMRSAMYAEGLRQFIPRIKLPT
jgi:hypothetical protein